MKVKEAIKITDSFTKTSKMPGLSYSLPAWECKTGSKLRKIGAQSRVEIEKLFNKKVFLETPIKISKNWRDDEKKLKKFGYQ